MRCQEADQLTLNMSKIKFRVFLNKKDFHAASKIMQNRAVRFKDSGTLINMELFIYLLVNDDLVISFNDIDKLALSFSHAELC